jgi:hypothetical protein
MKSIPAGLRPGNASGASWNFSAGRKVPNEHEWERLSNTRLE